jgi:exopolysaccharide production protein ExoZ
VTIESPGAAAQKLHSVQMLRAAAALTVLLYHLVNTGAFGWMHSGVQLRQPAGWISAIGFAGVDLFFVISGVVMVLTCYDRFGRRGEWAPFLWRRVARIYPLYWLATAAVLTICWIRPELASRDKFEWTAMVKSLLLWPQPEFPIVAVGWTLTYEMFFYVVFTVLLLMPRDWLLPALAVWGAATVAFFSQYYDPAHRLTPEGHLMLPLYASPLALEFIAGCIIGWLVQREVTTLAQAAAISGLAVLMTLGGYVGMAYPLDAHYGLMRAGVFGGGSALLAYGCIGLEKRGELIVPRWMVFWGDASYSTYLTHMYALWLVAAALPPVASASLFSAGLRTLMGLAACGAVAATVHVGFERPLIRLIRGVSESRRRGFEAAEQSPR